MKPIKGQVYWKVDERVWSMANSQVADQGYWQVSKLLLEQVDRQINWQLLTIVQSCVKSRYRGK
jgi:hypothetical protein